MLALPPLALSCERIWNVFLITKGVAKAKNERKNEDKQTISTSSLSRSHSSPLLLLPPPLSYRFSLFTAFIVASCDSITTSPGNPLINKSALAALLDFAKSDSPKAISSEKPSLELRKPVQFFSESEKNAEKNSWCFLCFFCFVRKEKREAEEE